MCFQNQNLALVCPLLGNKKPSCQNNRKDRIYLVKSVKVNDNLVTDHLWFNYTKVFAVLGILHEGDVVSFNTRITSYKKAGHQIDYKLERPTKVKLVSARSSHGTLLLPDTT